MAYFGTVKKWYNEKGFGFITGPDGVDVFAHHTDLSGQELMEGGKVQYDVTLAEGKPKAINVLGALQPRTCRIGGDQKTDPGQVEHLVNYIKMQQRSSPPYKELWQEFCDRHGGGVLDPARHRYPFLVAAIKECEAEVTRRQGPGGMMPQQQQQNSHVGGQQQMHQHHQHQHQHHHQHHQHQMQYDSQHQQQFLQYGFGVQENNGYQQSHTPYSNGNGTNYMNRSQGTRGFQQQYM
eukprot:TRINITY_DN5530_c0_g2_i1.p1 TRINITY_DN5530_c0_g2~~TRINITY_DN5530_c0_g2_i1.p1  ORF type:complete len:236 (+),score=35.62 TRINITY_DN5530_c0_g2_i1:526-1233(+)